MSVWQTRTSHLLIAMHRRALSDGWGTPSRERSEASRMPIQRHMLTGLLWRPGRCGAMVSPWSDARFSTTPLKPGRPCRRMAGGNSARPSAEAQPCHTCCAEGVDVFILRATLGHASSAATGRYVASNSRDSSSPRLG